MRRLEPAEMIDLIASETPFEAVAADYSFQLKIEAYVPYICGAVHNGHQFRKSLWEYCARDAYERWYEEDPATYDMVADHPIVITGRDSRFEYDLNRPTEACVFDDAWGKPLWKRALPEAEKELSRQKHRTFYEVVHALMAKLEEKHGSVLVIDMHSYNWRRWNREVPTWNLGTSQIDTARFGDLIESWRRKLADIQLPYDIPQTSRVNDVFYGKGYFLKYITENFANTLVLATEIAKVYCDEYTGIVYPEVVASVSRQLKELIPLQLAEFRASQ